MEAIERSLIAYGLLDDVLRKGAYSSIELNKTLSTLKDERDKAYVTKLFYGVLSKNIQLEYYLSRLIQKRPKPAAALIIKMGAYMLNFMDAPDYAVINTLVELIKRLGKRELSGFINAVLRRVKTVELPPLDSNAIKDISVNFSCPEWIVKVLVDENGVKFAKDYLGADLPEKTHIRANLNILSHAQLAEKLPYAEQTNYGFFVTHAQMKELNSSEYVIQSLSSCIAANYYAEGLANDSKVLDLCAAPGGKSVYLRQLTGASVTACDLHAHRVSLIRSYAKKTGTNISVMQNDATVYKEEFFESFDAVICDVPCSGLGVLFSKPDVLLSKTPEDLLSLSRLQGKILSVAAKYVKKGGALLYSTCTVTKTENECVVEAFLNQNNDFVLEKGKIADEKGYVKLYPQTHGCDGFFVAKLRRKNENFS